MLTVGFTQTGARGGRRELEKNLHRKPHRYITTWNADRLKVTFTSSMLKVTNKIIYIYI